MYPKTTAARVPRIKKLSAIIHVSLPNTNNALKGVLKPKETLTKRETERALDKAHEAAEQVQHAV